MKSDSLAYSTFSTPAGPFSVAVNEAGAIVATAFGGAEVLREVLGAALLVGDQRKTAAAQSQIEGYFRSPKHRFTLALAPVGTEFQKRVWEALRRIPPGATRSYGEIARELGSSARAVGRANATNPICLIVPCHRVIGADGSLTGFAFGTEIKRRLLEHEGVILALSP